MKVKKTVSNKTTRLLIRAKGFSQYETPSSPYLLKQVALLTHHNENKESYTSETDICFAFNTSTFFVHNHIRTV